MSAKPQPAAIDDAPIQSSDSNDPSDPNESRGRSELEALDGVAGHFGIDEVLSSMRGRSFVRDDGSPASDPRFSTRYYRREADGALVGRIRFGAGCQGPPGHAHGGSMAAVLDDAMGIVCWISGHQVVAAEIKIRFRNLMPLGTVAHLEATVADVDGKKVRTRGHLVDAQGRAFATGEGLFIHLGSERFRELAEEHSRKKG